MRQYVILYKRGPARDFVKLKPHEHHALYSRDQVVEAIELMRQRPAVEGICVRVEDELFNVMGFDQPAEAPDAFRFEQSLVLDSTATAV